MIRIGIVGSDNSHAMAFSKLANLPDSTGNYAFPDIRVTAIYGTEPIRTMEVAKAAKIPVIVKYFKEMIGQVDAVMVVFRHGGLHFSHAMPFIQAKIPTWIDKPFTINIEETKKLIACSKNNQTLLAGGSTCKYCPDVLLLKSQFERLSKESKVISGQFNFPGELDSPYGRIYFYGGHAAEILTTIFGNHVKSIRTDVHCGNLIAIAKYESFTVTINFSEVSDFFCTIYSPLQVFHHSISIASCYQEGFTKFAEALRNGKMVESYNSLIRPVLLLNALDKAIHTGNEIFIQDTVN